jgi:hypothetical protein
VIGNSMPVFWALKAASNPARVRVGRSVTEVGMLTRIG